MVSQYIDAIIMEDFVNCMINLFFYSKAFSLCSVLVVKHILK